MLKYTTDKVEHALLLEGGGPGPLGPLRLPLQDVAGIPGLHVRPQLHHVVQLPRPVKVDGGAGGDAGSLNISGHLPFNVQGLPWHTSILEGGKQRASSTCLTTQCYGLVVYVETTL